MKRSAVVLMVLGVVFLIFAFTVPPFMIGQARTLPKDLDMTMVSSSPQGYTRTEHLTSSPTKKIDEIAIHVEQTTENPQGEAESTIIDQLTLIGHSRFPVLEPTASISGSPFDSSAEVREGLHYFFPANTLRNSYQFYDIVMGDTTPVDYVSREGDVYTYFQNIRYAPIDEDTSYSVERTLDVEKNSGIIINKVEKQVFHTPAGDKTVEYSYTPDTREYLKSTAADIVMSLDIAKVMDFFSKFLGLLLLGIGAFKTGIFSSRFSRTGA